MMQKQICIANNVLLSSARHCSSRHCSQLGIAKLLAFFLGSGRGSIDLLSVRVSSLLLMKANRVG